MKDEGGRMKENPGRRSRWAVRFSSSIAWFGVMAAVALSTGMLSPAAYADRVPKPVIEAGQGEKCVENTEFMRKNHMKLLNHQRDKTMHLGIRTRNHSLNGCIECHASRKNNSVVGSDQNFCQSCHSYVAVKLDCFECHTSKPRPPAGRQTDGSQRMAGQETK